MRLARFTLGALFGQMLLAVLAQGAEPAPSLRLVPSEADVLLVVPHARQLVESGLRLQTYRELQAYGPAAEFFRSNGYRRFQQLLVHFENELGAKWPELLDRLAADGVALGIKIAPDPAPAVLVIQGKDAALQKRFFDLALTLLEQAADDDKPQKRKHRDIETVHGKDLHLALAGSAIVASNQEDMLKRALDLHLDGAEKSLAAVASVRDAWKLLGPDCLARLWINLETVKQRPEAKPFFTSPPGDPGQTVLLGGMLDVARRSSFVCAGLYRKDVDYSISVRMPAGREGMAEFMALHIPPAGKPGSRALLEPRQVMLSTSFYLDLPTFWEKRKELLPANAVQGLEEGDKNIGKFLPGAKLGTLLSQAGVHHRFVVVNQEDFGYKRRASQPLPAFAIVTELSDPEPFARSMNTILRAAALAAGAQLKMQLAEEKHGSRQIVGYRFSETAKITPDPDGTRFAFSPAFVTVGNQFVVSSTIELARELVDLLEQEAKEGKRDDSFSSVRARAYTRGGAAFARNFQDLLVTQAVLGQALDNESARKQVMAYLDWLGGLGNIDIDSGYTDRDWHYDFRIKLK